MRQLAAILFADMTGYTALIQENEYIAIEKRKRLKEVLENTIPRFNGKILQYYGDGSLSIFQSAIDSVLCSIDMQRQLQREPKVSVRMGIHTGDVIIEADAIYGDGVNLASRIESLAVPGGIFISEKVYEETRNQQDISTMDMGYFEFKNVKHPIRVFAVANNGIIVPKRSDIHGKTKQPFNRLAVLPFINMSSDPENEYFSDGIAEELLNALTRVEGLQVTSRTSAFAFKGKLIDVRDIASQLNVDKVLEGSVRKSGNRVRITAQLINAVDGYHIWSENYDRDLTDIFEVQDEISGIITNKLRENLTLPVNESRSIKAPKKNITAYTFYLKGLHYWNKITPADSRKAIECFEKAILEEAEYAQAWAMTALCYSHLGATGQMLPEDAFAIVHHNADKALALDNTIAEGYVAKATSCLFYEWKWQEAYDLLTKAKELNPGLMDIYRLLGFYYAIVAETDKGVAILEEALNLDPLSPIMLNSLGNMYSFAGRFDDALKQADKLLEIDPKMRVALDMKGWVTGMKGDWKEAMKYFEEVHSLTNHPLKALTGLAFSYGQLGEKSKALELIKKMEQRQQEESESVIAPDLACAWFAVGDRDKANWQMKDAIENL
ncbi:MAG: adenylate/guanylate cyclase domain-containing protein, partial [Saprospiraceae bacterium]